MYHLYSPDSFNSHTNQSPEKIRTMKKNMNSTDRIVRIIVALIFAALYFTGTVSGTTGVILIVLAAVFTLTSIISFCPLYAIFGISTCPSNSK
jgi:hypothetical protein